MKKLLIFVFYTIPMFALAVLVSCTIIGFKYGFKLAEAAVMPLYSEDMQSLYNNRKAYNENKTSRKNTEVIGVVRLEDNIYLDEDFWEKMARDYGDV